MSSPRGCRGLLDVSSPSDQHVPFSLTSPSIDKKESRTHVSLSESSLLTAESVRGLAVTKATTHKHFYFYSYITPQP